MCSKREYRCYTAMPQHERMSNAAHCKGSCCLVIKHVEAE